LEQLNKLRDSLSEKEVKQVDLVLWERIITRLREFSPKCNQCMAYLTEADESFNALIAAEDSSKKTAVKANQTLKNEIISHLQKEHHLVPEGYYIATFMALGVSLGMVFGMVVFDNIGLGMPLGIAIGAGIGAGKDADAKKKGLTI
jgi:hypothetical protein